MNKAEIAAAKTKYPHLNFDKSPSKGPGKGKKGKGKGKDAAPKAKPKAQPKPKPKAQPKSVAAPAMTEWPYAPPKLNICKDFQNGKCTTERDCPHGMHLTSAEATKYKETAKTSLNSQLQTYNKAASPKKRAKSKTND